MNKDKTQLQQIIDNRMVGVKNKDVEQATGDYSTDVILYDIVDPLEHHGIESVKKRLRVVIFLSRDKGF